MKKYLLLPVSLVCLCLSVSAQKETAPPPPTPPKEKVKFVPPQIVKDTKARNAPKPPKAPSVPLKPDPEIPTIEVVKFTPPTIVKNESVTVEEVQINKTKTVKAPKKATNEKPPVVVLDKEVQVSKENRVPAKKSEPRKQ